MRIVADTNIIISAFLWRKRLSPIYNAITEGNLIFCFIEITWEELKRTFAYPKFERKLKEQNLSSPEALAYIEHFSEFYPNPKTIPKIIKTDPADNAVLAAALISGASFIVSGDKHLLRLRNFPISIKSPRDFIKEVLRT